MGLIIIGQGYGDITELLLPKCFSPVLVDSNNNIKNDIQMGSHYKKKKALEQNDCLTWPQRHTDLKLFHVQIKVKIDSPVSAFQHSNVS